MTDSSVIGDLLKGLETRRVEMGLQIADVAKQLHITSAQVEAMERGDFQLLPGPAFTRGYLRNYSRLLQLDPSPFLEAYDHYTGGASLRPSSEVLPRSNIPLLDYGRKTLFLSIILAILLIWLAWWIWGQSDRSTRQMVAATSSAAAPTVALSQPAPVSVRTQSGIITPVTTAAPLVAATASSLSASAENALQLSFTGDCWVQVRDASGRILLSTLAHAGEQHSISTGTPPYQILLGRASAAMVFYHGKRVPLPANDLGVARLTIGTAPVSPTARTSSAVSKSPSGLALNPSSAAQSSRNQSSVIQGFAAVSPSTSSTLSSEEVSHAASIAHSAA